MPEGLKPHYYVGLGHMVHPDDVIDCCPYGPGHEIHIPRPEPRTCGCNRLSFRHLWHKDCPEVDPNPEA